MGEVELRLEPATGETLTARLPLEQLERQEELGDVVMTAEPEPIAVAGRVVDETGSPLPGVAITGDWCVSRTLDADHGGRVVNTFGPLLLDRATTTAAAGTFAIHGRVPAGAEIHLELYEPQRRNARAARSSGPRSRPPHASFQADARRERRRAESRPAVAGRVLRAGVAGGWNVAGRTLRRPRLRPAGDRRRRERKPLSRVDRPTREPRSGGARGRFRRHHSSRRRGLLPGELGEPELAALREAVRLGKR